MKDVTVNQMMETKNDGKKHVTLAIQGGGAHGAFTWGVMDRLLEEKDLVIEGVSGTSAGGMNAVCIAQGIMDGGNEGARRMLRKYWETNAEAGKSSIFKRGWLDMLMNKWTLYNSPGFIMFDYMTKMMSPYQFNPLGTNPLKDMVKKLFKFEQLNKFEDVKVFLSATHVYTGKIKVFTNKDLCPEAMLASACLPTLFSAVQVNNEYYWDGGYISNPLIYPLIYNCKASDIIIMKLNPTHRNRLPMTPTEIGDRLNEITNNTSIMREMRSVAYITKLIDEGLLDPKKIKRLRMHLIENEGVFQDLGWSSKLNTEEAFLNHLFEEGRKTADKWIEENYQYIGKKTTVDMKDEFI